MTAWIVTSLRRLRDERLTAVAVSFLVLVTAFIAAATPRLLDRTGDDALQTTLAQARPADRNIQLIREDRYEPVPNDPFRELTATADLVHGLLPARVSGLVVERAWTAETGRWRLPEFTGDHATMRLRFEPDAFERLNLEAGRWPTAATARIQDPTVDELVPPLITQYEVALPVESARVLRVGVGDSLVLKSDASDPLVGRGIQMSLDVVVVGTFTVVDPSDEWWLGTTELVRPTIRFLGDLQVDDTTALMANEAYGPFMIETRTAFSPLRYTFREYVDPTGMNSATATAMLGDLRRLEVALPTTSVTFNSPTGLRTGLRAILERFLGQWATAISILTVAGIGPAGVAAAALGLVAVLAAQRRRSALALTRGRGASVGHVISAVVAEGILITGPAAVLAVIAALVLLPADPVLPSVVAGAAVAVAAVALLVVATVPATAGPTFSAARDAFVPRRPTARRLIFEGLVILLATGGALLLRQRGIAGAGATSVGAVGAGGSGSIVDQTDPLLAAVPALLGIAAALAAVRIIPLPMRLLAWLAGRRRDLVPVLAMRRATSGTASAAVFVVLLATAAIGAFSSAVIVHIDRSADVVAWVETGADYRLDGHTASIRSNFDPAAIPGVEASAAAWTGIVNVGTANLRTELVAVAASDYETVVAGTPADPELPLDMLATSAPVVAVLVSPQLATQPGGLPPGTEFNLSVQGHNFPARVLATRDAVPALTSDRLFIIASRDQMASLVPTAPLVPTRMYLKAPDSADAAIRAAVTTELPAVVTMVSRSETSREFHASAASRAVATGLNAAAAVAFAYAVIAIGAALALAGAARAIEVAHLRSLGLTGRQAVGLVLLEHGPLALLAFILGTLLGLGIFVVLRDGLGLGRLVASDLAVPITFDPVQLLAVLGAILVVVGVGLGLGAWMQRSAAPVAAVRRGFE
jgi:putative ABC transport system permease protein